MQVQLASPLPFLLEKVWLTKKNDLLGSNLSEILWVRGLEEGNEK